MSRSPLVRGLPLAFVVSLIVAQASAHAGWRLGRRPTARSRPAGTAPSPMLGSFYPNPYMIVRGSGRTGGGSTPNGYYGENSLALYGPLSPLRATAASVLTYSRGYDGVVRPGLGTGF